MNVKIDYCSVSERDMDMLFLNAFATDENFVSLFIDKTDLKGQKVAVESVQLSKEDNDGESDITLVIKVGEKRYGLLVEDKINAPAMDNQSGRYTIRGNKGKKEKLYDDFEVFIVCPEKYYENNDEAKKYPHHIFYEEIQKYFEKKNDPENELRVEQIKQAVEKGKRVSNTVINEKANVFFNKYLDFMRTNYPDLICVTSENSNGWWPHFKVDLKNAYIIHKAPNKSVDLTFSSTKEKKIYFDDVLPWIKKMGFEGISAVETGKSIALSIGVPKVDFTEDFEKYEKVLPICFDAIRKLTNLAKVIGYFSKITESK